MGLRGLATGFAAGDHALCFLESRIVNEDYLLLFGCGVEEVARHRFLTSAFAKVEVATRSSI